MTSEKLIQALRQNPFVLAPMAGITDNPFRTFMREQGAGVVITELVSAHGIEYASKRTIDLMSFDEVQRPLGVQLFGEDPEIMARAAQFVERAKADFVDINMGCPVPKVVKKGAGSALLKDPVHLRTYLETIRKAINIPLTIKIRTGWDECSRNADDVVKAAHDAGVTWVAIHGRTRAQGYSGFADWDMIRRVKEKSPLPIIGNGDIHSAERALERLNESGCDGVMIGRGCLKNPWIFKEAYALWQMRGVTQINAPAEPSSYSATEKFHTALPRLKELLDRRGDDRYTQLQLRKFSAWFSAGYPYSGEFRKTLFQTEGAANILSEALGYFDRISNYIQQDTSGEAFLMGGHG